MRTLEPQIKLSVPAHPRFKGFEAFAAREIYPHIAGREAERHKVARNAKLFGIAAAAIVAALLVLGLFGAASLSAVVVLSIVTVLIAAFAGFWPLAAYSSDFNDFLVARTCAHLQLRHMGEDATLPIAKFVAAGFLPAHDKHRFEDAIACDDPGMAFNAAETRLIDSDGDSDSTAWRGLLMELPVQRPFEGHTLVVPRGGKLQLVLDKRGVERIELGVSDLDERLEIRTTHPAETRAVLTLRFMRRLADLAHRLGNDWPALRLVGSSVLVAIESDKDRFQAGSVFQPIDVAVQLRRITADIALLLELAETLHDALGSRRNAPR